MDPEQQPATPPSGYITPEAAAQDLVEQARLVRGAEPHTARGLLEQAFEVCPEFPGLCMELGEVMADSHDFEDATVALSQVPYDKRDLSFYLLLARCYSSLGKYLLGIAQLKVAESVCGGIEVLFQLGKTLYESQEYAQAVVYFERYLHEAASEDLQERRGQALNYMGVCLFNLGEIATALSYFEQSFAVDDTLTAGYNRVLMMRRLPHIAEATREFELEFYSLPGVLEAGFDDYDWTSLPKT